MAKPKPNECFTKLINTLIANWPLNEERAPILAEYRKLFDEVGQLRFQAAVEAVLTTNLEFFPSIGKFRTYLESGRPDKRSWWRDPNCPDCHGTGWTYVPEFQSVMGAKNAKAVRRCTHPDCLHHAT